MSRHTTDRHWRRWTLLAVVAVFGASIGLYTTQQHHFQHHNERVLQALASSSSIHVQLHAKNTPGLVVKGRLFPRTDTTQTLVFDGRLTYDIGGQEYNYTVVNNRGYVTIEDLATRTLVRNDCLRDDEVPPMHLLTTALRDARVVDAVAYQDAKCDDGKLVEFRFANEPYVFCSRPNGAIDKIYGHDIQASVELLNDNAKDAPTVASFLRPGGQSIDECAVLTGGNQAAQSSTMKTARRALSRAATHAKDIATVISGRRRLADEDDCSTACKGGKKICLFVHGLGKTLDAPMVDTYPEAWGKSAWEDMNCCSQIKFVRMDTVNYPWYTALLANKVCDAAMNLTKSADPMQLENIAIITHSMGNLIVAGAAMKQICAVGPTSKWIALAGPISGSRSANFAVSTCDTERPPVVALNETVHDTLTAVNLCPAKRGTESLVYKASEQSLPELDLMYNRAIAEFKARVTSSLCGVSSIGLASTKSGKYAALGLISGHGSPDDGAVEIDSCGIAFGVDAYQKSWKGGRFYRASINHADASLHAGDGLWGDDRKPVKWLNCQF